MLFRSSMEILSFLIVSFLAFIYSYLWWKIPEKASRKIMGLGLSIVGLIAVVISGQVYTLPARLAWDTWQTTAGFILTAFILGAVSVAFLLSRVEDEGGQKAKKALGWIIMGSVVCILVAIASFAQTYGASEEQTAAIAATFSSHFFLTRLILGLLLPITFAGLLIAGGKNRYRHTVAAITLAGVVFGEVAGRILFYSSEIGRAHV